MVDLCNFLSRVLFLDFDIEMILRDVLWLSILRFSIIYRWFHLYVTEDSVNFSIQSDSVWNLLFSLP